MSYSQSFAAMPTHLYCLTVGKVDDARAMIEWGEAIVRMAKETGMSRVLIDNREFVLELSPLEVVEFARDFEEKNIAVIGLRLAVMSSPSQPETTRLIETVLTNRSASYRRFANPEEALVWLEA